VAPAPLGAGGRAIVIVASNHYPNYLGLRWFLEKVLPLAPGVDIEIYGNIYEGVRSRDAALYEAHQRLFKGRAPDIGTVYANAGCVLLPTTDGYGLSIKAVEALSSGAPLITTPAAFRGMSVDPRTLANVAVAERAEDFAAALRDIHARLQAGGAESSRATTDSRRYYDEAFSNDAYARALAKITVPMVCG
jgi:glycosyltransferase involved in cell wall biosynthesis